MTWKMGKEMYGFSHDFSKVIPRSKIDECPQKRDHSQKKTCHLPTDGFSGNIRKRFRGKEVPRHFFVLLVFWEVKRLGKRPMIWEDAFDQGLTLPPGVAWILVVFFVQTQGSANGPMVNCWFGARWLGFLGSPYERDCYLRAPDSNPKPPSPKPTIND